MKIQQEHINNHLGRLFKKMRSAQHINQKKCGKLCGVTQAQISAYESGKTPIPLETLFAFAQKCKIHPLHVFIQLFTELDRHQRAKNGNNMFPLKIDTFRSLKRELEELGKGIGR